MTASRTRTLTLAITVALVALPASGQQASKAPKTNVWMDVATHSMAGMPEMGGATKMAMGMFGGSAMQNHYGNTRFGGMPGHYVDIAMLNTLNPGVEAEDQIPAGLKLGNSLPLVPPKTEVREDRPNEPTEMKDTKARILIYWGCGSTIRPGQPKEIRIDVKDGQAKVSGSMQGRYVPDRTAKVGPSYALWPNERNGKSVPDGASLVGEHHITGAKVPESLKFTLEQAQDFMPKIALESQGSLADGQTWRWQPVDRARAYYLHAFGTKDDAIVMWSSSETADAGMGVFDYLPGATIDKWIKEKVLLDASATTCAMPQGIFAAPDGKSQGGGGMLRMIAFGPESNFAYPPRPSNPKTPWTPEWNVRVRNKSTTTAVLGMDAMPGQHDGSGKKEKPKSKMSVLKGLLGG